MGYGIWVCTASFPRSLITTSKRLQKYDSRDYYLCPQVMETEAALEAAAMEAVELSVPPDEGQSTTSAAATVKQEVGFEASSEPAAAPALGEEEEQDVKTNPWYVDSLDHFRYYVCPECATTRYVNASSVLRFIFLD